MEQNIAYNIKKNKHSGAVHNKVNITKEMILDDDKRVNTPGLI